MRRCVCQIARIYADPTNASTATLKLQAVNRSRWWDPVNTIPNNSLASTLPFEHWTPNIQMRNNEKQEEWNMSKKRQAYQHKPNLNSKTSDAANLCSKSSLLAFASDSGPDNWFLRGCVRHLKVFNVQGLECMQILSSCAGLRVSNVSPETLNPWHPQPCRSMYGATPASQMFPHDCRWRSTEERVLM